VSEKCEKVAREECHDLEKCVDVPKKNCGVSEKETCIPLPVKKCAPVPKVPFPRSIFHRNHFPRAGAGPSPRGPGFGAKPVGLSFWFI
jgi:hypothetical protein